MGGRLIPEFNLYTSKYGIHLSLLQKVRVLDTHIEISALQVYLSKMWTKMNSLSTHKHL